MNLRGDSSVALAKALVSGLGSSANADVAVCPASVYLREVAAAVAGSPIGVGAQNFWFEKDGAFTGELSAGMLQDAVAST